MRKSVEYEFRDQPKTPIERARQTFELETSRIQKAYRHKRQEFSLDRNEGRYVRPWDSAENFAKREAYDLIARILSQTSGGLAIKNMVKEDDLVPLSPGFSENPFYWGLLAMHLFDHDENPKMKISAYAPALLYAYRHRVPPAYLIGFIYQVGRRSVVCENIKFGKIEDEFLRKARACKWA